MAMLQVDLRGLDGGALDIRAQVAADDPLVEGLDLRLVGPLDVEGTLRETGEDEYLWQARLRGSIVQSCRRCLIDVPVVVDAGVSALYTADEGLLDDPSAYALEPMAVKLDLGEAVREELALSAPRFVVCKDDCKGLCPGCGADLNTERCTCAAEAH